MNILMDSKMFYFKKKNVRSLFIAKLTRNFNVIYLCNSSDSGMKLTFKKYFVQFK